MSSLLDLPAKLMSTVCSCLDQRSDILALRQTFRQVCATSVDGLLKLFDSITLTYSKANLRKIETLLDNRTKHQRMLDRVTHVTVHVLRAHDLIEHAVVMKTGLPQVCRRAYSYARHTLIHGLNAFPNLKIITLTNELQRHP
jgi:hypothetical protein